jgi:hypothetical protein
MTECDFTNFIFEKTMLGSIWRLELTWRVGGGEKMFFFSFTIYSSWLTNYFITIILTDPSPHPRDPSVRSVERTGIMVASCKKLNFIHQKYFYNFEAFNFH